MQVGGFLAVWVIGYCFVRAVPRDWCAAVITVGVQVVGRLGFVLAAYVVSLKLPEASTERTEAVSAHV